MSEPQKVPTPADLVQWKLYYEARLNELKERHAKEIAETKLVANIEACNAWLLNYLNTNKLQNCKTEYGTFHKITKTSVTLEPEGGKDLFLQRIFLAGLKRALDAMENNEGELKALQDFVSTPEMSLLDARPLKTAVFDWLEKHQAGPETLGCKINQYVELGFRKT